MAITKLPSGKYQAKIQGPDGRWISKSFASRKDAEAYDFNLKTEMRRGTAITAESRGLTLDEYFTQWFETVRTRASEGWRREQSRNYRNFVSPILGKTRLESITPQLVARVLNDVAAKGKSEQTQLHIFSLMRKLFGDANEIFRLITYNPAQKSLKPKVPMKETAHLNLSQTKELLLFVKDKQYGVAIWLQLYLGLRIGELQALRWEDVDLDHGVVHIRRAYVRKEKAMRDYPKGRKQHSHRIPSELLELLREERQRSTSELVAISPEGGMLAYEWYFRTLRRYCKTLGITTIGTHGLRHSTSELYLSHGANRDDIRQLFAHSSNVVTDRYIHHRGTNLERIANVIQLFPANSSTASTKTA